MMTHAYSQRIIDVAVFEQRGGWVFLVTEHGNGFYNNILFSGKRRSLELAMSAVKEWAGNETDFVYHV